MRSYVEILAENVRDILAELDRKPAWLAKKSGVAASQISRLLDNQGNPSLETITSIAIALDRTPTELLRPKSISDKSPWDSPEALKRDIRMLVGKLAEIELAVGRELDPDKLEKLMRSRKLVDEEIFDLKGRVNILEGRKVKEQPEPVISEKEQELLALVRLDGGIDGLIKNLRGSLADRRDKVKKGSG